MSARNGIKGLASENTPLSARLTRNVRLLVAMQGVRMTFIAAPVLGAFFLGNGLSPSDFLLLQSAFSLTIVVVDLPAGYLADRWSRRGCLLLSDAFYFLAMIVLIVANDLAAFFVAQILMAVSFALSSGADTALLYESLSMQGHAGEYQRIERKAVFFGRLGEALGCLLAAACLFLGAPRLAFVLSAIRSIVLFGMGLALLETARQEVAVGGHLRQLRNGWRIAFLDDAIVRWFIFVGAILVAFSVANVWLTQALFVERLPEHQGWLPILLLVSNLAGAILTASVGSRVPSRHLLGFLVGVLGILAAVHFFMGAWVSAWVLLGTVLFQLNWACVPLLRREINDRISAAYRTTTMSYLSLLARLMQTTLLVLLSVIVARQVETGFLLSSAILVIATIACLVTRPVRFR